MGQVIEYRCDLCSSADNVGEDRRIAVFTERAMDPSGNGYDTHHEYFDLCHACAVRVLKQMVGYRPNVPGVEIDGPRLAAWLKTNKRK